MPLQGSEVRTAFKFSSHTFLPSHLSERECECVSPLNPTKTKQNTVADFTVSSMHFLLTNFKFQKCDISRCNVKLSLPAVALKLKMLYFYSFMTFDVYLLLRMSTVPSWKQSVSASCSWGLPALQISLSARPYRAACTLITPIPVTHTGRN